MDINSSLLKRYASCKDEEDIKKAEELWLGKLEREYAASRADAEGGNAKDAWRGGNMNRRAVMDSGDENSDGESQQKLENATSASGSDSEADKKDPYDISDNTDDEEEMAELRRKVLQSKPFVNPSRDLETTDAKAQLKRIAQPELPLTDLGPTADSDNGTDDDEDDAFDNIINATPVTDRSGIQAKQRLREQGKVSAVFSKAVLNAPRKQ